MSSFIAFWNILLKDMRNYYFKPPNISWGILFPISWILMMFIKTGSSVDGVQIFPGILSLSILFGTTSMLSVTIPFERRSRSFERLLLSPISTEVLILAKTSGAFLFGIFNSLVPIALSLFYFKATVSNPFLLFFGIMLLSALSTLFGLFLSVTANEVFEAQTYSNFFRLPMIFLCGLFLPIEKLPALIKPLSYILPVTYGVDIIKFSIDNSNSINIFADILLVLLSLLLLFSISIVRIKKVWIK